MPSCCSICSARRPRHEALTRPYPAYEAVGIVNPGGEYNQLSTTLLQIENEFYGTIRPKRVIRPGERPLHALRERGVEYVEVRLMDLDPFVPVGIKAQTMRFLDVFLLHCLTTDSPPDSPAEIAALGRNQHKTAAYGRQPGLLLERNGREVALTDWGGEIVRACEPIAAQLDAAQGTTDYGDALRGAQALLNDPAMLPSTLVLDAIRRDHADSFTQFVLAKSLQTKSKLLKLPYPAADHARLEALAAQSVAEQAAVEAADTVPFETFRQQYISAARLELNEQAVAPALAAV
jgi:glutamate--cysteine ligase